MELTINHQKKVFNEAPPSLEALLQLEGAASSKGIAVALNNRVIPKTEWAAQPLQENDTVLIITATQGG